MKNKKHQALGQLAYTAPGENQAALEAFFRGLDRERRWFAYRPRAKNFRRALSKGERLRLGYPLGSELVGHRLSNGRVAWFIHRAEPTRDGSLGRPTSEERLQDIAAAVAKSMGNRPAQPTGGVPATAANNVPAIPTGDGLAASMGNVPELGPTTNPESAVSTVPKASGAQDASAEPPAPSP